MVLNASNDRANVSNRERLLHPTVAINNIQALTASINDEHQANTETRTANQTQPIIGSDTIPSDQLKYYDITVVPSAIRHMRTEQASAKTLPNMTMTDQEDVADSSNKPHLKQRRFTKRSSKEDDRYREVSENEEIGERVVNINMQGRKVSRNFQLTKASTADSRLAIMRMYLRLLHGSEQYDATMTRNMLPMPSVCSEDYQLMQLSVTEAVDLLDWVWDKYFPGGMVLSNDARSEIREKLCNWYYQLPNSQRKGLSFVDENDSYSYLDSNGNDNDSGDISTMIPPMPMEQQQQPQSLPTLQQQQPQQYENEVEVDNNNQFKNFTFEMFSMWFLANCKEVDRLLGYTAIGDYEYYYTGGSDYYVGVASDAFEFFSLSSDEQQRLTSAGILANRDGSGVVGGGVGVGDRRLGSFNIFGNGNFLSSSSKDDEYSSNESNRSVNNIV